MRDLLPSTSAASLWFSTMVLTATVGACVVSNGEDPTAPTIDGGVDASPTDSIVARTDTSPADTRAAPDSGRDDTLAPPADAATDARVDDTSAVDSAVVDTGTVDTAVADTGATYDAGASAHDLWVATTGSDSNPGTKIAPLKTILRASQLAVADTMVHVLPGTYVGGFQTTKSGTATGRIHYVSEVRHLAKIVPPSSSSSKTGWDNRGAYVTIDGFEVDGSIEPTSGSRWTVGINVGGQGDVVTHCLVHHVFNTGVGSSSGGAGILLDAWYGFNDMQALGNEVHHVGPPVSGSSWYHGIYQTATGVIANNLVYANAGGGIHLWHDANHITIVNNTSFGNGIGYIVGGGDYVHTSGPCDYVTVVNNIAYDNSIIGFDEEGAVGTHNVWSNDLSFKNGTNWRLKLSPHTADVSLDPQFVRYVRDGGGDYRLLSSSPAIDKGRAAGAPAIDFFGSPRPYVTLFDIGAYEWRP